MSVLRAMTQLQKHEERLLAQITALDVKRETLLAQV